MSKDRIKPQDNRADQQNRIKEHQEIIYDMIKDKEIEGNSKILIIKASSFVCFSYQGWCNLF